MYFSQRNYTKETLNKAIDFLNLQEAPNISVAQQMFGVPYTTLRERFIKQLRSKRSSHTSQQLLTEVEEFVLVEWLEYLADQGLPVTQASLLDLVHKVCGKRPNQKWIYRFLERHKSVTAGKPSGLDPKRAQAFNRTTVRDHFNKLCEFFTKWNLPKSHLWNMDEKGIQRGGGRRLTAQKYFVPRSRRPRYTLASASLELTTIIEAVNGMGDSLLPGFIFQGKELLPGWVDVDPEIWCENLHVY
jgi:hypothetical protein